MTQAALGRLIAKLPPGRALDRIKRLLWGVAAKPTSDTSQAALATAPKALSTEEELRAILANNPTKELVRSVDLAKEVFPEAKILGRDDTDWEAHRQRLKELERTRTLGHSEGCWNCGSTQLWTWPGGVIRCARCHPPAEPDGVIWLGERS